MVRRFYICGGNNPGDPADKDTTITDDYFLTGTVTGVFKEGYRYFIPVSEWQILGSTITVLNGSVFERGEVIIVEVSPKRTGAVCPDIDPGTANDEYYLPDIIKCVVARVNSFFENRDDDPFSVHYDRGLYNQVGSDKLKDGSGFLTVWLMMPYDEDEAKDTSYSKDVTCDVIIAVATQANYTQQQREDISYHPRLYPAYSQFIAELKNEQKLENPTMIEHTYSFWPFWGGGDVNGVVQNNIWKNNADCIKISGLKLKKGNVKNCSVPTNYSF